MNQEMIERYVTGRLSESETEGFEDYCVAHPEFARQVEFEQRLKSGITEIARGSTAEFVRSDHPLRWSLAAAAGLIIAIIAMFYLWNPGPPARAPAILASVMDAGTHQDATLRLAMVRGSDTEPLLPGGLVRVEIVGLFDGGNAYSVALDRLAQNREIDTVATLNDQRPGSPVSLEVIVDSEQLRPGAYSLRVRKQASGEEALDFGFIKN